MQPDDYTKIDQYIQGELPDEALVAFKERLAADQAFADALEERQAMQRFLQTEAQRPALEKKMEALGGTYFSDEKEAKVRSLGVRQLGYILAVAASIALLLLVWNPFQSSSLYEQYAQHPVLALVEKSEGDDLAQQAETAFADQNYEAAYQILQQLVALDAEQTQAQLALGISALETNRVGEARAIFQSLADGGSTLSEYGSWYLILTAVREENGEEAKRLLDNITFTEAALRQQAVDLAGQL